MSARKIAVQIGRHHSSIAREIQRNSNKHNYHEDIAQTKYQCRRRFCKPKGKFTKSDSEDNVTNLWQKHITVWEHTIH